MKLQAFLLIPFIFFCFASLAAQSDTEQTEIQEANVKINNNRNRIIGNSQRIDQLKSRVDENTELVGAHDKQINTIRNRVAEKAAKKDVAHLSENIGELKQGTIRENRDYLNQFWILIAAVLVFFMQAGFKVLEVGMVRKNHGTAVGIKNLVDWLVMSLVFYFIGFGIMFGESNGLFGWSLFSPTHDQMRIVNPNHDVEFFLYQLTFAATAATIVSGATSERIKLSAYVLLALVVGTVIYPVVGHAAWGDVFLGNNTGKTLLGSIGFMDFAGSTVVHSVGGWIALVSCIVLGQRRAGNRRRFDSPEKGQITDPFQPSNLGYAILGVFLLWFGWWGFNGGSTLAYDFRVARIIQNTNIAGATAGLTALALAMDGDRRNAIPKAIGGTLGGLVAITACCQMVTSVHAIYIGFGAGVIHNLSWNLLAHYRIDDAVGAFPVHGACGIWGTLCVGIFGNALLFSRNEMQVREALIDFAQIEKIDITSTGTQISELLKSISAKVEYTPDELLEVVGSNIALVFGRTDQIWAQTKGIAAACLFTIIASALVLVLINFLLQAFGSSKNDLGADVKLPYLRISSQGEQDGDILGTSDWIAQQRVGLLTRLWRKLTGGVKAIQEP